MKKTLIKVMNLNGTDEYFGRLRHISFRACEGEVCYFMGFNTSEIRQFIRLVGGDGDLDLIKTAVFLRGQRIYDSESLRKQMYVMKQNNYGLRDWSVAKYLLLNQSTGILTPGKMRSMEIRAEEILRRLRLDTDVRKRLRDLDVLQRRQLEVAKAICCGASIVTFGGDDFFGGMPDDMIRSFCAFLRNAQQNRMATLLIGGADTTIASYPDFADRIYVLDQGTIVKKIDSRIGTSMFTLEGLLLGKKWAEAPNDMPGEKVLPETEKAMPYFCATSGRKTMMFPAGTCSVIVCQNNLRKEYLYRELTGRSGPGEMVPEEEQFICELRGTVLKKSFSSFLKARVISLNLLGTKQDVFENLSVQENILITSMEKLTLWQYMKSRHRLQQMMGRERRLQEFMKKEQTKNLNINDRISLVMERWLLFRPNVLVLFEPFLNTDRCGVTLIVQYIREFCGRGTAVIIIKSNTEFIETSADQIYAF